MTKTGKIAMDDIRCSTDLSDVDLKVADKEAEKYGYKKAETEKPKKSIKVSLAEKKKPAQVDIIGCSGGALAALNLSLEHPDLIKSVAAFI